MEFPGHQQHYSAPNETQLVLEISWGRKSFRRSDSSASCRSGLREFDMELFTEGFQLGLLHSTLFGELRRFLT